MVFYQKMRSAYGAYLSSRPDEYHRAKRLEMRASDSGYVHKKQVRQARLKWKPEPEAVLPKNSESTAMGRSGTPGQFSGAMIGKKALTSRQVRQMYQKKGCAHVCETRGIVSDPDMCAIGHQAFQFDGVTRVIFGAIIRKLLMKAGVSVDSTTREIDWSAPALSSGFRIVHNLIDGTGTLMEYTFPVPDNSSINSLFSTVAFLLKNHLQVQMQSEVAFKLQKVWLYHTLLIDSVTQTRIASMIDLNQEILELSVSVTTGIQNRTPSVEGSALTDTVSVQPLKGPIFEFSGIPKTKVSQLQPLNSVYDHGVILFRNAQLAGLTWTQGFVEVPVRNSFQNVVKSSYSRLAVSVLKNFTISKTWKGNFTSLLLKWRVVTEAVASQNTLYSGTPGPCQVAFFEEEINSGSEFKITLGYETQHTIGAHLSTRGRANMEADVVFNTVSNI